jgi:hypothetical protein
MRTDLVTAGPVFASPPGRPGGRMLAVEASERDRLRATFDSAAALYQQARPDYPAALYDALAAAARIGPADRLLEPGDIVVEQFDWEVRYDAAGYLRLLDTFSGHIAMAPWQRDRLYGEIRRRLAQRPDGRLRRHWGSLLHVARRRDPGRPPGNAAAGSDLQR